MDSELAESGSRRCRDLSQAEGLAARAYHQKVAADLELMDLVAEVEAYRLYASSAYESTEAWLAAYLGMGFMKSLEFVRIALGLQEHRLLREGYETGTLSYDHLRALIQVVTAQNQAELVRDCTGLSIADTFRLVDRLKQVDCLDSQLAHSERFLEMSWDHGRRVLLLSGQLPEEAGAKVEKAIDALAEKIPDDPQEECTPMAAKRADALCQLAGATITKDPARATVVVHVDAETLSLNEGSAEIAGGPSLAPETARRLLCDGNYCLVIDLPDGTEIPAGRKTSSLTRRTRRRVLYRDRRCRVPGCRRKKLVEVHHIQHQIDGGGHELENLVLLCEYHHRWVHEGGYLIRGDPPDIWLEHPSLPPVRGGPPRLPPEPDLQSTQQSTTTSYLPRNLPGIVPAAAPAY